MSPTGGLDERFALLPRKDIQLLVSQIALLPGEPFKEVNLKEVRLVADWAAATIRAWRLGLSYVRYRATPSTINMRPFTAACRICFIVSYAGELYQACACSELSNAITTIPVGGASPSRLSTLPPATTK
jgi:hypothetical protein